jgi:outer membrane protein OmpA-like peptidoglycan-associated protein
MKIDKLLTFVICAGLLAGCAATVPRELVNAREAYQRVSTGATAQVAPAELHIAHVALTKAEQSFLKNSGSFETRDLAYIAQRRAEIAEVTASISIEQKNQSLAGIEYQETQGRIVADTKLDLNQARGDLAASELNGEITADQLAASERNGEITANQLAASQKLAADSQAALARLAAVRDEPRGTVITLSGSVLFASDQVTLLPQARTRLDQVAEVLLTLSERNITIEGHTDSQGTETHNLELSQGRADAVRNYLTQRGYQPDRIQAHGMGEGRPIADNGNPEGRANNRRVEIIIERGLLSSN